ncbi:uncharacterized protein LOC128265851 [Drosophila gunungcola]|uniref:uncharacterized protein LOC128265851 n=1 Tax=Drosophila gunungcola TaxID=103775 RepID=UPI0022E00ECB|nr:uncharacterized protein LOC128265851 [Drosophila gunungcola]
MANSRGPKQHSRRIIATVVTSTILYTAPKWAEAMKTATYSRQCKTFYRRCALRITISFCTVSEEAALSIAGLRTSQTPAATTAAQKASKTRSTYSSSAPYTRGTEPELNQETLENQRNWDAVANKAAGILLDLRRREQSRRNEQ